MSGGCYEGKVRERRNLRKETSTSTKGGPRGSTHIKNATGIRFIFGEKEGEILKEREK